MLFNKIHFPCRTTSCFRSSRNGIYFTAHTQLVKDGVMLYKLFPPLKLHQLHMLLSQLNRDSIPCLNSLQSAITLAVETHCSLNIHTLKKKTRQHERQKGLAAHVGKLICRQIIGHKKCCFFFSAERPQWPRLCFSYRLFAQLYFESRIFN